MLDKVFYAVLATVFWISMIGTYGFAIYLVVIITIKAFDEDFSVGVKATLANLLAIVLCFVFRRYNWDLVAGLAETPWWALFFSAFIFAVGALFVVSHTSLVDEAVFSAVFNFILMSAVVFTLILILADQTETRNSLFLPIGFFVGGVIYVILDPDFQLS